MSALKDVFVRVHFRYDRDRYSQDLEQFAQWLIDKGYPNKTCRTHLYRAQQVLHAIGAKPGAALDAATLEGTFRRLARRRWTDCHSYPTYSGYLRESGLLRETPQPAPTEGEVLVRKFCSRLQERRGLASSTIAGYGFYITDFLHRAVPRGGSVADLTAASVERYIRDRAPGLTRNTFLTAMGCIRAFLLFCHERRVIRERIDHVDLPRRFRDERPPRALPWIYIRRLLASLDCTRPVELRDYTIIYLMAHYGLRTGEIKDLTLDSISWRDQTLTVWRAKTRSTTILPLHPSTLKVIKRYLGGGRPRTDLPPLFLCAVAPLRPMTKFAVSCMFYMRLRRSGLPIGNYTAYSLRHAFAMRLFERGVGMKAIGDLMGHRNLISTGVYLRLQADMLREVALPVPPVHKEGAR
jgi:site-specific recombinase XerD